MTRQDTFDQVVTALRTQGPNSPLQYRGNDGRRCAVGWLIPDDQYDPRFEGYLVPHAHEHAPAVPARLRAVLLQLGHDLPLVKALQSIHDNLPFCEWEAAWADLARREGLTYTPPQSP